MIKKNDTGYLVILGCQALGILINLVQILFNGLNGTVFVVACYVLSIVLPIFVIIIEWRGMNVTELMYLLLTGGAMLTGNAKMAKAIIIKLVSKYNESYIGHKLLADIYEKEGRNEKGNR
jgi:hypothetical protein